LLAAPPTAISSVSPAVRLKSPPISAATTRAGLITKPSASALRAKGEDLIRVGGRRREGDNAPGIGEVEWCRARGQS
jgi:hypothetical protein